MARTDELSSPAKYYEYMKAGAEAGIAPKVWYLNVQDKISITDFIEKKAISDKQSQGNHAKVLKQAACSVAISQTNNNEVMDGMVQRFQAANLFRMS